MRKTLEAFVMPWIEEASLKVERQTDTYLMLKANTNWFKGGASHQYGILLCTIVKP
jgi:hypothetical protein